MNLSKFLTIVVMITMASLFYVHQEIELVKQSYEVQTNQQKVNDLLDQNRILKYNVSALKAPFNLEDRLAANNIKLVSPERWQVVHVASSATKESIARKESPSKIYNFFKLFSFSRVAQAKPIN